MKKSKKYSIIFLCIAVVAGVVLYSNLRPVFLMKVVLRYRELIDNFEMEDIYYKMSHSRSGVNYCLKHLNSFDTYRMLGDEKNTIYSNHIYSELVEKHPTRSLPEKVYSLLLLHDYKPDKKYAIRLFELFQDDRKMAVAKGDFRIVPDEYVSARSYLSNIVSKSEIYDSEKDHLKIYNVDLTKEEFEQAYDKVFKSGE